MIKWFLSIGLFWVGMGVLFAHSPEYSSTLLKEQENNEWVLVVRAPLTALQYEITEHYGESAYSSPEEFQDLIVNYLKENIAIRFNEKYDVVLQKGMVKLGHETNVVFQVAGMSGDINSLSVKNSSFKDIHRHQSALIVFKEGIEKDQFILNEANKHEAELRVEGNKFKLILPQPIAKSKFTNTPTVWIFASILILFSLTLLWIKK